MDDLVSRADAIEAAMRDVSCIRTHEFNAGATRAANRIKQLPSAQPEIIYCGDCKYKDDGIDEDGIPFLKCLHGRSYGGTRINDFCSWAERREDG